MPNLIKRFFFQSDWTPIKLQEFAICQPRN